MSTDFSHPLSLVEESIVNRFLNHVIRSDVSVHFCGHHECHATNAFLSSPYSSALTVSLDGGGLDHVPGQDGSVIKRYIYGAVYRCFGSMCVPIYYLLDFSFGQAWERTTRDILNLSWGEEGTTMAMAGLGDPNRFAKVFDAPFLWLPNFQFIAHTSAEELKNHLQKSRNLIRSDQDRFDMAAALQFSTEQRLRTFLEQFFRQGVENICLTGGFFLNCQVTGKIQEWFPQVKAVFIPPAPYDGAISMGAAQVVYQRNWQGKRRHSKGIAPFAMGRRYSRMEILSACRSAQVQVQGISVSQIVELLQIGKIIGIFCGPAEIGRRALGNRSIIADPRRAAIKDRINVHIKHRQFFRPLAPMVLAEHVQQWFECDKNFTSPYMSFAVRVRPEHRERIPAVVHVDGTARVQTVHRDLSPETHELLSAWNAATGVPILLNTSFNDHEPIVENPHDALNTFKRVSLDGLYFVDYGMMALASSR
jgi:carbamoyltransferase